jgi:hypothetical protein
MISQILSPAFDFDPFLTNRVLIVPENGDGTSTAAFSVSKVNNGSPALRVSPSETNTSTISASSKSPRSGITIFSTFDMLTLLRILRDFASKQLHNFD